MLLFAYRIFQRSLHTYVCISDPLARSFTLFCLHIGSTEVNQQQQIRLTVEVGLPMLAPNFSQAGTVKSRFE